MLSDLALVRDAADGAGLLAADWTGEAGLFSAGSHFPLLLKIADVIFS
jgi:hypothetical protein